jgi:2-amino-4-hydroxy-6-hydroxymethyldihydropteridine diphosphokinase
MPQKMKREEKSAYIGVGSNIEPGEHIPKALDLLSKRAAVRATSTFYRTRPIGDRDQPEYRNGVWRIETPRLLKSGILRDIERILKRTRSADTYASRTIDLDLLLYDDSVIHDRNLAIPDPDIYRRQFVAAGLFELDPDLRLPDSKIRIRTILERLNQNPLRPDETLTLTLRRMVDGLNEGGGNATQAELWRREYDTLQGMHLSYTESEPAPVTAFRSLIRRNRLSPPKTILDIGCGQGRIGLHLAQAGYHVIGLDVVPSAVRKFARTAKAKGLESNVSILVGDMQARWDIPDHSVDGAFAITVMDNLMTVRSRRHFIGELRRVLSYDGLFMVECYTGDDGYYGKLLRESNRESGIVTDPNNGMRFMIYTDRELLELLAADFTLVHRENAHWRGVKYNQWYARSSVIWAFQRTGCR